jgi:hypothetical protein
LQYIHRSQVIFGLILLSIIAWKPVHSQTKNREMLEYSKWVHFGFTIGTNIANFRYELSRSFYNQDSLLGIKVKKYPGLTLGAISDIHLGEYFDFRVIPSLILSERAIEYKFKNGEISTINIESILGEIPFLFKYKSFRHGNVRFYLLAGAKVSHDFSSNANASREPDKPLVALTPWSYSIEFGWGFDMYFEYFKFSPEFRMSKGFNNVHTFYNDIYNNVFQNIYSNYIYISFNFEG